MQLGEGVGIAIIRLAENVTAVVLHERVASRIQDEQFETVLFVRPEDWFSL